MSPSRFPASLYFSSAILIQSRFVPPSVAKKYDLDLPNYAGVEQIVEFISDEKESKAEAILKLAER